MKKFTLLLLALICLASISAKAQSKAIFYTNMGNFDVTFADTSAPETVDSFIARISSKFYDGLLFHRVIDGFMIQGGDPKGDGTGGPGYTTADEVKLKNVQKSIAMAKTTQPHTNGSQFYINLVNNTHLDAAYTVFGTVTSNFTVVQTIAKVPKNGSDKPLTDVVIDSIRMTIFPLSVSSIPNGIAVAVYPNPSRGLVAIDLPDAVTKVSIANMNGQTVYTAEAKGQLKVDLRDKPAGLYMIHTANEQGSALNKLIVQ